MWTFNGMVRPKSSMSLIHVPLKFWRISLWLLTTAFALEIFYTMAICLKDGAFQCDFPTSDLMCMSFHKTCSHTFQFPFFGNEFFCAVWDIYSVWKSFHMFHSWISSLHWCLFFTFTLSLPQINWCFCKLSFRVYTLSHFSHLNLPSRCVFCVSCKHTFSHTGVTNIALLNCVDVCNMLLKIYAVAQML